LSEFVNCLFGWTGLELNYLLLDEVRDLHLVNVPEVELLLLLLVLYPVFTRHVVSPGLSSSRVSEVTSELHS
jgi:hypothetical protein